MDIDLDSPPYRASILNFLTLKQEVLGAYAWKNLVTEGKGIVVAEVDLLDADYKTIALSYIADAVLASGLPALREARDNLEATGTLRLIQQYAPDREMVIGVIYLGQMKPLRIGTTPPPPACQMTMPFQDVPNAEFLETYLGWSQATVLPAAP